MPDAELFGAARTRTRCRTTPCWAPRSSECSPTRRRRDAIPQLSPAVARAGDAGGLDKDTRLFPSFNAALADRDARRDGGVHRLCGPDGRRSHEHAVDRELLVPAGPAVRALRRDAAGGVHAPGTQVDAGPRPARRHPHAGRVPDRARAPRSDVARAPRHLRAREHPVPADAAAAGRREHDAASAVRRRPPRASASPCTKPTRAAPAATRRSIPSASRSRTTTPSAPTGRRKAGVTIDASGEVVGGTGRTGGQVRRRHRARQEAGRQPRGRRLLREPVVPLRAGPHGSRRRRLLAAGDARELRRQRRQRARADRADGHGRRLPPRARDGSAP